MSRPTSFSSAAFAALSVFASAQILVYPTLHAAHLMFLSSSASRSQRQLSYVSEIAKGKDKIWKSSGIPYSLSPLCGQRDAKHSPFFGSPTTWDGYCASAIRTFLPCKLLKPVKCARALSGESGSEDYLRGRGFRPDPYPSMSSNTILSQARRCRQPAG